MNRFILINIMGTLDQCPYVPRSKMAIAEGTAMALSAGASALGNILGFGSAQSANKTNLQIARETNQAQRELFHEQMAYNTDMWNKQNQYNLPVNQVQRLLAAGINPLAVFGNGSISEAGQLSAPGMPQMQRAEVLPFTPDFNGVGQAVNAFFDNQMKSKAVEGSGIDNQMKMVDLQYKAMHHVGDLMEQKHRIDKMISESNLNKEQKNYLVEQSNYLGLQIQKFRDSYDMLVEREKIQNDVMRSQQSNLLADATLKRAQTRFQNLLAAYYPQLAQSQINTAVAEFNNILQQTENLVKEGKLTNVRTISQEILNKLSEVELDKEENKRGNRYGKFMKEIKYASEYIGGLLLDNVRLFK